MASETGVDEGQWDVEHLSFHGVEVNLCCRETLRAPVLSGDAGGTGDHTGIMVWRDAFAIASYMARAEWLSAADVFEVGCGTGFVSVVLAKCAKTCWITDGADDALRAARASLQCSGAMHDAVVLTRFDWADPFGDGKGCRIPTKHSFDAVVGAEVVYPSTSAASIAALLDTASFLVRAPISTPRRTTERDDRGFAGQLQLPTPSPPSEAQLEGRPAVMQSGMKEPDESHPPPSPLSPLPPPSLFLLYVPRTVWTTIRLLHIAHLRRWCVHRLLLDASEGRHAWLLQFHRSAHATGKETEDAGVREGGDSERGRGDGERERGDGERGRGDCERDSLDVEEGGATFGELSERAREREEAARSDSGMGSWLAWMEAEMERDDGWRRLVRAVWWDWDELSSRRRAELEEDDSSEEDPWTALGGQASDWFD